MRFGISRLTGAAFTVFVSSVLVFGVVRLIPGDPILVLLQTSYSPAMAASLRSLYGLDHPLLEQYVTWIGAMSHGDFGYSIATQSAVGPQLVERVPRTMYLLVGSIIVAIGIALPAGIIAARSRGRWPDTLITGATTLFLAVPPFFMAIILIVVVAVGLHWAPAGGFVDPGRNVGGSIHSMMLPWLTVGLHMCAFMTRVLRSSILDALTQEFITTARSRGLSEWQVLWRHALRNAAIPMVTVIGLDIGYLLGGAIVVEQVFAYPGMGRFIIDGIERRDYPVIQAGLMFFAIGFVLANIATDALYGALDPRVRSQR